MGGSLTAALGIVAGDNRLTGSIADPDPQPGTVNTDILVGTWIECGDRTEPGVAAIVDCLEALPYRPRPNCAPGAFYLARDADLSITANGGLATVDPTTLPPVSQRHIGDALKEEKPLLGLLRRRLCRRGQRHQQCQGCCRSRVAQGSDQFAESAIVVIVDESGGLYDCGFRSSSSRPSRPRQGRASLLRPRLGLEVHRAQLGSRTAQRSQPRQPAQPAQRRRDPNVPRNMPAISGLFDHDHGR